MRGFFISYDNQVLLGVILQCGFPSCNLQFGHKENIRGNSVESRTYWFILKIASMFPIITSRNRMMNTFVIVNITPHVTDGSKDLFHSVWPGTEYTRVLIWKKSLLICFESYHGILYSHTDRVDWNLNILFMVSINPIHYT